VALRKPEVAPAYRRELRALLKAAPARARA